MTEWGEKEGICVIGLTGMDAPDYHYHHHHHHHHYHGVADIDNQ